MDNKSLEFLNDEEQDLTSLQVDVNVLKLGDPPKEDYLMSLYIEKHTDLTDKNEDMENAPEELLNLGEPPVLANDGDNNAEETVAISKFAEEFVEPILKEVIARHKSEIEDDANELPNESNVDKKSEKSSSDDGFELVKGDDVIEEMHQDIDEKRNDGEEVKRELEDMVFQEEMHQDIDEKRNDGDEVKRELEDMVFQEEMRLESSEKELTPEMVDEYKHDDGDGDTELTADEMVEVNTADITQTKIANDDLLKEEDDVLRSMDNLLDSIMSNDEHIVVPQKAAIAHEEFILQTEPPLCSTEHDIKGKCKDIISWIHPVSSAVVFSILMFIELGLMLEHSIISLLAYSGLLLMIASFLYKIAVNFKVINTQSSMNCIMTFNKEDVEYCVDVTLHWIDYLHKEIKSIAYMESFTKNIKVFAMLWVLTYIGQMFNLQSLIFIGSLLLFSMPVVYGKFKTEIDAVLGNVCGQICGTITKIKSKCQRLVGCH